MECPLCQLPFAGFQESEQAPRILIACGHSLCTSCTSSGFALHGKIDCPVCVRETVLPTDLKGLPINVSLMRLLAERSDGS